MTSVPKEDAETTRRIRKLNDHLRTTLVLGGQVVFTDTFLRQPEDYSETVLYGLATRHCATDWTGQPYHDARSAFAYADWT